VRAAVASSSRLRLACLLTVPALGLALELAALPGAAGALRADPGPILVLALLTLLAAVVPLDLRAGRSASALDAANMAQPFAFAMLLGWGAASAVVVTGAGAALAGLARRWRPRAVLLGSAPLALAPAAAGATLALLGVERGAGAAEPPALLAAMVVFLLVGAAVRAVRPLLAGGHGRPAWRPGPDTWTSVLLLGLAPVVAVVAERERALTPLLLLPVVAVGLAGRRALQAERQHELAEREQARARAAAEAMLATVSHELRAPLTVVLGSLDSLSNHDGALGAEDRRELVTLASRQGRRLKRLVEQLMLAAQVENGMAGEDAREAGRRAVVDAVAMMREAGATTELCHPDRRVRLKLGGPLPVRVAPEALLQVLTNLLDNAAKYSPQGTPIRMEASRRGGQAVIAVEDAGPGVPEAERERIFERFSQLEAGAGHRAGGIGLGLYIARQLARAHGGDLVLAEAGGLDGAPDPRGARFELCLPLADEDAARVRYVAGAQRQ
jgi:signal transduction histidine kinase